MISSSGSTVICDDEGNSEPLSSISDSGKLLISQGTSVSPKRIFNSPVNNRLREIHTIEMQSLKQKLYNVTRQLARAQKRIKILNNALASLTKSFESFE